MHDFFFLMEGDPLVNGGKEVATKFKFSALKKAKWAIWAIFEFIDAFGNDMCLEFYNAWKMNEKKKSQTGKKGIPIPLILV